MTTYPQTREERRADDANLPAFCANCRFFHSGDPSCRRHAPKPYIWAELIADPDNMRRFDDVNWPTVNRRDWCGDFEPAPVEYIDRVEK